MPDHASHGGQAHDDAGRREATTAEARRLRLDDGRVLDTLTAGDPDGLAVVFHHGTPFAPVPSEPAIRAAEARGLHLIGWARPGYAASTRRRGRRIADVADDARQVLDALGHDRFVTLGWSGGGPHALATAAVLPERCAGAATIGGVAPYRADGLDWLDGMGPENVTEFSLAVAEEADFIAFLEREARQMAVVTGAEVAEALGGLVSEVDRRALTGDFAEHEAQALRAALAHGIDGWYDDDKAFVWPWGFDLAAVGCDVAVWHGGEDRMVPFAHGSWLVEHLPRPRAHLLAAEGHLSLLVGGFGRILDDLLELAA